MNLKTGGTHTLLVTPFTSAGDLDLRSLCTLIDFTIDGGVDGVVVLGTTGEFFTLTPSERMGVTDHVIAHVDGRVAVTVGVGSEATATAIELARHAQLAGADCVMVLPPFYFDSSAAAQETHFRAVAQALELPMMLYDGAGGIPVSADIVATIAQAAPHLRYVKLALPEPARVAAISIRCPELTLFAGDDSTLVAALRYGAAGSAIATGNIQPKTLTALHNAFGHGELDVAIRLFAEELAPSIMATSTPKSEFIARFKEVLAAKQIIASPFVRPPLRAVPPSDRDELLFVMRALGVL